MKKITYVTGNWAKIASAKQALEPLGYEIDNVKMETPEIQAYDVTDVSKYSAKWAAEKLGVPVLKNDTGLFVNSLNGFPGIGDRTAYFKESIAYCEPGGDPVVFEGVTKGKIDTKKSGTYGWSWDFIFIPDGEDKTLGCFPDEERWNFWSIGIYKELTKYLDKKQGED